jgi:hypothetical protein
MATSSNKVKAARKIIKKSGNSRSHDTITKINCGDKLLNDTKDNGNAFTNFYTEIVTNLNNKHNICKSLLLRNIMFDNIVQTETIPTHAKQLSAQCLSLA